MPVISLFIILVTVLLSVVSFSNKKIYDDLILSKQAIRDHQQWYRLFTHALIHSDWIHLAFNMISFWFFAPEVERVYGGKKLLALYLLSILGGAIVSLYRHRHQKYFYALGASAGVVGVVFSFIIMYPFQKIYLFLVPIGIPAWLFGVLYIVFSTYYMRSTTTRIGHDAHIGGALVGVFLSLFYLL